MSRFIQILPFLFFATRTIAQTDTVPPVITCPPHDTVTLSANECAFQYFYAITANDLQSEVTIEQLSGLISGTDFPLGNTVNVFVATDTSGNSATCSFQLTVQNFAGPLSCKTNLTVSLDSTCSWQPDPAILLDGNFGCLDSASYLVELDKDAPYGNGPWVPATIGPDDVNKTYAFRVTETDYGNSCTGNLQIKDMLPPVVTCEAITISCAVDDISPAYLKDSLGIAAAKPFAMDACGPLFQLSHIDMKIPAPCDSFFTTIYNRRWTAQDQNGNTSSCIQTIRLARIQISDLILPADVALSCANPDISLANTGQPYTEYAGRRFTNLCALSAGFTDTTIQICPGSYRVQRTWAVIDWCTSEIFDTIQIIDIEDKTGPVFQNCPSDVTVQATTTNCLADVDLPDLVVADACSYLSDVKAFWKINNVADTLTATLADFPGNDMSLPDTLAQFGVASGFPSGIFGVSYVATDNCGNTSKCDFALHVWDSVPPLALCKSFLTVNLTINGSAQVNATAFNDGTFDFNFCGTVTFKASRIESSPCQSDSVFDDVVIFCCAEIGDTINVQMRAYDILVPPGPVPLDYAVSQSADCVTRVIVTDNNNPPKCSLPPNVTVSCENFDPSFASYGDATLSCKVDSVSKSANYSLFDTLCHRGTITRVFRVYDTGTGHSNQCTQRVVVTYQQDYFVRFPDDAILTACDASNIYGEPVIFGADCEFLAIDYEDVKIPDPQDGCRIIERTWTIINWCTYDPNESITSVPNPQPDSLADSPDNLLGPTVSSTGTAPPWSPTISKIKFDDVDSTDYSTFWSLTTNGYRYKQIIKIFDNQVPEIENCHTVAVVFGDTSATNDSLLWNAPHWLNPQSSMENLCEGQVDLQLTATDFCTDTAVNIRYLLFLDLDGDGTPETVVNSDSLPAAGTVNFGNAANPNYAGGDPRTFDERPLAPDLKYRFAQQITVSGNKKTSRVAWNTDSNPTQYSLPQLPHGAHKIQWTVEDACGNEAVCEYDFTIEDARPPSVICIDSTLTLTISAGDSVTLFTTDVLQNVFDNCTPVDQLMLGIRKEGMGAGFPDETQIGFSCADLAIHTVQLWARDLAGNAGFCTAQVIVTADDTTCSNAFLSISGQLRTETDAAVVGVDVAIDIVHPSFPTIHQNTQSDQQGAFAFPNAVPKSGSYTLTPVKDINPLNGVSTFDLLQISKHILGLEYLNSPYKIIAADANHSESVTTFDIVEIRKLILGIYDALPDNTSWRFVDKSFTFPNPANPFQSVFPESITRSDVTSSQIAEDFIGIKVGDVNNSSNGDSLLSADDRSRGVLFFDVKNRDLRAGETFTVDFKAAEKVSAYQFTLNVGDLEIVEIKPGEGMGASNFGIFPDAVTAAVESGAGAFSITFRSRKSGQLDEMLHVSSRITRAEAYKLNDATTNDENDDMTSEATKLNVALRFDDGRISQNGFELYQNQPNPFRDQTRIGFYLPENADATLTVFDDAGRVLHTESGHYAQGHHVILLEQDLLGDAGVLFYKLETATDSAVRRMVRMR